MDFAVLLESLWQWKKKITPNSEIEQNLKSLTETRTAGDPDAPEIVFTDLTPTRLEQELEAMGTPANDDTIRQWMEEQNLRLRKIGKVKAGGESPDRDAQFENIAQLIEQYEQTGNPYFSVDTKAKEFQGQLFRAGRVRCSQPFEAFDHDFPSWADGVIRTASLIRFEIAGTSTLASHVTRPSSLATASSGTGIASGG